MKPSALLELKRSAVRAAAERFRTVNPRVFGSVVHGDDAEGSDIDLLVDPLPGLPCLTSVGCKWNLRPCWVFPSIS